MGERKGVNKWYPPDYDPSKGGLNKWQGTHALRERARKLHLGILIIRFEMPYNIWCDGCENHIGTGVRYNAEKKKVGMYYTTPVYEFRMKCHLCDNHFTIKTDPAGLDYEITSGARRQERRWDPSENEQVAPEDKAVGRKMAADAMFKLEHGQEDTSKARALQPVIRDLEDLQHSRWEDDFSANQALRQRFRANENAIKAQEKRDARHNLNVPLLPPSEEDVRHAAALTIALKKPEEAIAEKKKIIDSQSVFTKMRPKRISRAVKKDIAKQSIHNIVAAGTSNFDTFKNEFLDKQLGSIVIKKKRKHRSSRSIGLVGSAASYEKLIKLECDHGSGSNSNNISRQNSLDSSPADAGSNNSFSGSNNTSSSVSSPYDDRPDDKSGTLSPCSQSSIMSPTSDTSMSYENPYVYNTSCGNVGSYNLSFVKTNSKLPSKSTSKRSIVKLPSIEFGKGNEVLNFVTNSNDTILNVDDRSSSVNKNFTVEPYIKGNASVPGPSGAMGLLVDYSGSESD